MDITCPKCGFTRTIPDDKIPDEAVRATCPKCKHKFQFRELPEDFVLEADGEPLLPPLLKPAAPEPSPTPEPKPEPRPFFRPEPEAPAAPEPPAAASRRSAGEAAPRRPLIPWDAGEEAQEEDRTGHDASASSLLRPPPRAAAPGEREGRREEREDPLSRLMRAATPPGSEVDAADTGDDVVSSLLGRPAAPERFTPGSASPEPEETEFNESRFFAGARFSISDEAADKAADTSRAGEHGAGLGLLRPGPKETAKGRTEETGGSRSLLTPPAGPSAARDSGSSLLSGPKSGQTLGQTPGAAPGESDRDDIWRKLESLEEADASAAAQGPSREWMPEGGEELEVEAPWERLDKHGFFGGLWRTTTRVMFHPGLFFDALPVNRGLGRPLAFYVLMTLVGYLLMLPWAMTTVDVIVAQIGSPVLKEWAETVLGPRNQLLRTAIQPVLSTLLLFFYASILHVSLFVFQGAKRGFEATFRALAYSAAPMILFVIPFVGPVLAELWSLAALMVGLRRTHRTSYAQVILAMLLPVAAVVILTFAVVFALSQGGS